MAHPLRILCPNEQCQAMIALLQSDGTFDPLRARIAFGRGGIQTLICTECGAQRQWLTRPLGQMVTAKLRA